MPRCEAISRPATTLGPAGEWRVHFHVPIYVQRFGRLEAMQGAILDCLRALGELGLGPILGRIESSTGFAIDSHRLEVFGICPDCQAARASLRSV